MKKIPMLTSFDTSTGSVHRFAQLSTTQLVERLVPSGAEVSRNQRLW
ncbi:hypothetical protein [Nostoc sp.]